MERRRRFTYSSLALILLLSVNSALAENAWWDRNGDALYRLPGNVRPITYDLSLRTRLAVGDYAYRGRVEILLDVVEKTNVIVLHADKLTVQPERTYLVRESATRDATVSIYSQDYDPERQFYVVSLLDNLQPGRYVLGLSFLGEVRDDVFGFYRSAYEVDGRKRWAGFTQFSPGYARRAFPCMDEPYMKANYTVHIGHYANQTATSNMPIESVKETDEPSYYITTFTPTPRLPTYVVGWAVHDFVREEANSPSALRIWTRDSMKGRGQFSLKYAEAIFAGLRSWLRVDNPLEKLDYFAVPDFNFNAMENWGLINYRESAVLFDEESTPTSYLYRGLNTMTHELAHTWFGNLVTPKFWDVAWLKEGFATFFQYYGMALVKELKNTWMPHDIFVVDVLQPALLEDTRKRTMNNVDIDVGSSASLMKTLDFTAYKKGASIIRMMQHFLGEYTFGIALRNLVNNMSQKSVEPADLYKYMQEAGDYTTVLQKIFKIKDIMETWTTQAGYPLVTVTRNYSNFMMEVTQEPFYLNREEARAESRERRWWIPLNIAAEPAPHLFNSTRFLAWLRPQDKSQLMALVEPIYWIVLNVQQTGYYRVNYDETNWKMLIEQLTRKDLYQIHKLNRAQLIDDSYNLARAGYIIYDIPVKLSRYLVRETEYEPWLAAFSNFKFLHSMLPYDPVALRDFKDLINEITSPLYNSLGFEESPTDTERTKLLRNLILSLACLAEDSHCLKTSDSLFRAWIANASARISPNLKSIVYCEGIRSASEDEWGIVWERFLRTDLHTEQELLLNGLGCTQHPNLINKFLNASISPNSVIRKQYKLKIVNAVVLGNPKNVEHTFEFVQQNRDRIIKHEGYSFLGKMLGVIGERMITEEQLGKLNQFVDRNKDQLGPAIEAANDAVLSAANNIAWIKKRYLYPKSRQNAFR